MTPSFSFPHSGSRVVAAGAVLLSAAAAVACAGPTQASLRATDSCRYLTGAEVEPYVGPLVAPPYRVGFDDPMPARTGAACLYHGRDGRELMFSHSVGGARLAGTVDRRVPTLMDRTQHNADPSSVPAASNPSGGAAAVMGPAGPGPWDNSNWFPTGTLIVYKNDDAFEIDISAGSGGKAGAVDLATLAMARLGHPLQYDGAAAVAQAPKPVRPVPPCTLVPRARAEAILGPLAADPAPDPDGNACTYVVGSPDGRVSYALGITWTGGYKELNSLKRGTSMVTEAVGPPGMGHAVRRSIVNDTTLVGPWDAGALVDGSWLVVTKHDVGLTIILGTADYDRARALLAAACGQL